jgi:predicted PurR-regulated permease PerM
MARFSRSQLNLMTQQPAASTRRDDMKVELTSWRSIDVLRVTALVVSVLLTLLLIWVAREIVLTAFIGVLFGLAVSSGAGKLARLHIPRGLAAAVVVFGFIGLLGGIAALVAPALSEQALELRSRIPQAVSRLQTWVNNRPGLSDLFLGGHRTTPVADSAKPAAVRPATAAVQAAVKRAVGSSAVAQAAVDSANASVPTLRQRVSTALGGATHYLFPFLSSTVTVVLGVFLVMVLSIYIGADPELYHRGLMHLFPHASRARVGVVLSRVAMVLRKWLVTQCVAMVVIGVATTVALLLLHVKAAFALGVIAGLLEFIPTIGPILSALPGIAMGVVDSPQKALSVTLAYLVIQQLEGHLLIPMLMKEGLDLPPALTIVAQGVMALLFGFLGLLIAVPLLAAVLVFVKLLYVEPIIGDEAYPIPHRESHAS